MTRNFSAGLACALCLFCADRASAQMIHGGEMERGLRSTPGSYFQYDNMPLSHRNFDPGHIIYLNGNGANMWYLEYLDRVDRAEKNGYCPPRDPFATHPSPMQPRFGFGFGAGRYRWR